ncbi:MAG: Fe-S cluster assembly protein SufD [Deltaproteobacteria bacterium]|nr:Fe-S cluster assembly protein SufD [Deltaproteobacteria bacterium]
MQTIGHYQSRFEHLDAARRAAGAPEWVSEVRRQAIARFAALGFPGPKHEEWRATSVASIAAVPFEPDRPVPALDEASFARLLPSSLRELAGPRLVFVNGVLDARLSSGAQGGLSGGIEVLGLASMLERSPGRLQPLLAAAGPELDQPFAALNAAFFRDGAFVSIPEGVSFDQPVQLVFVSASTEDGRPALSTPRTLVQMGEGSSARLVETYLGGDASTLTDAVTEIHLGAGASLEHYRLERESTRSLHLGASRIAQARHSRYRSFSVAEGGELARHELQVRLAGEGAACVLDGLSLACGRQLIDHHTFVDHASARTSSAQLYKGILDGQARAVFQGRVLVRPGAQKTDARQANRNLLLSAEALANARPQLEIHADDVRCTHGATVGQLDREALFYLRSRGIGAPEARAMLTEAFAGEVLQRMELAQVRQALKAALHEKLLGTGTHPEEGARA